MGSAIGQEQQPQANFVADVELVLLHVAVIDPEGGDVPPLTVEDFSVFDDDLEQGIKLFVTPTDAPLDVALVLDSSASMKPVELLARRAALSFLGRLAPDDCAYVLPFSGTPGPGRWGRSADPELLRYISGIRSHGGTALYDAILEGLARLERADANELVSVGSEVQEGPEAEEGPAFEEPENVKPDPSSEQRTRAGSAGDVVASGGTPAIKLPPRRTSLLSQVDVAIRDFDFSNPPSVAGCGESLPAAVSTTATNARRKALVVLSDGADLDSTTSFYEALSAARSASVPVFPVALGFANEDPSLKAHLEEIARATGGRMIYNDGPGELGESYDQVVTLLRSYYLIGYDPDRLDDSSGTASGGRARWHDVTVTLRRPNFESLVRPGYYR